MPSWQLSQTWVVALDAQRSNVLPVDSFERGSFQSPAAITAANFQVEVSNDGVTYAVVKADDQTDVAAVALAANKVFNLPANVCKAKYARLFLSAAQAAARSFTVQFGGN